MPSKTFVRIFLPIIVAVAVVHCKPRGKSSTLSEDDIDYLSTLNHASDYEKLRRSLAADDSSVKYLWDFSDGRDDTYFINGVKYTYHFQFVDAKVPHYPGSQYNDLSSYPEPKKVTSGQVFYLPDYKWTTPPFSTNPVYEKPGVLAFAVYRDLEPNVDCTQDPTPKYTQQELDEIVKTFKRLRAAVPFIENRVIYVPGCAKDYWPNVHPLRDLGVPCARVEVIAGNPVYNVAKSFGYLKKATAAEMAAGEYTHKDILVLSELPLDIGPIAGLMSTQIQVPGSHVRLRAKALDIPNMFLKTALSNADITANFGNLVAFETQVDGKFKILNENTFPGGADALREAAEQYFKSRVKNLPVPEANLTETKLRHWREEGSGAAMAKIYGAKATNFGILDNELNGNGYDRQEFSGSFMIPFSYYNQHVGQNLAPALCSKIFQECNGKYAEACTTPQTKCQQFANQPLKNFLQDMTVEHGADMISQAKLRKAYILYAQELIKETKTNPAFVDSLVEHIKRTYPDKRRIRFRSSTNAEDLPGLNGAGLYQSFAGCVFDTVTGDDVPGGSCNTPLEITRMKTKIDKYTALDPVRYAEVIEELKDDLKKKRKIGKTIGKVYASLWNEKAFLSRDFYGIDHHKIYMGILVHPSFVDELANGVAILERKENGKFELELVTQKEDVSVTNPEIDGATPENIIVYINPDGSTSSTYRSFSSLMPAGQLVLDANQLKDLKDQIMVIYAALVREYGAEYAKRLDFEYIVNPQRGIYMKQARPL
ncbi:MAG: PEP/pyruvate-binding domain-containing protein [Oligoflexales bacterium]